MLSQTDFENEQLSHCKPPTLGGIRFIQTGKLALLSALKTDNNRS